MSNAAALALLTEVAAVLGGTMQANHLMVGDLHVATARKADGKVWIREAIVFDGHTVGIPAGLDESTVTPGQPKATVERIAAAIRARLEARATSKPVPEYYRSA